MNIQKLKLTNFRNFSKYELKPKGITIIIGPNGAGKTNLLEAIYLLSVCRSYRTRRDGEIIKWDEDTARIEIDAESETDNYPSLSPLIKGRNSPPLQKLVPYLIREGVGEGNSLNIAIAQTGDKKIGFIAGKQAPVSLLVGKLPVVIFAPEELDLLTASPIRRRRQIDVLLSQIDHKYLDNLLHYNKIIKLRNKILQGIGARKNKEDELNFWDEELIKFGQKILSARNKIAYQINSLIGKSYKQINPPSSVIRPTADSQEYRGDISKTLNFNYLTKLDDIQKFPEMLIANRDQEIRYGNTITGPHRDDWQINIDKIDARVATSRGQARAVILALKTVQAEILQEYCQTPPIMLLDDVFAELDRHHSQSLLNIINGNQVIITATDAEYIPDEIKKKAKNIYLNQKVKMKNE